jgi:hypothetical protein
MQPKDALECITLHSCNDLSAHIIDGRVDLAVRLQACGLTILRGVAVLEVADSALMIMRSAGNDLSAGFEKGRTRA